MKKRLRKKMLKKNISNAVERYKKTMELYSSRSSRLMREPIIAAKIIGCLSAILRDKYPPRELFTAEGGIVAGGQDYRIIDPSISRVTDGVVFCDIGTYTRLKNENNLLPNTEYIIIPSATDGGAREDKPQGV